MKKNKIILIIVSIVILIIHFTYLRNYLVSESLVQNIITFLSILFGFYITSFAIFVTSKYVASLYKITDIEKKDRTLLHTLLDDYKFGLVIALVSISYYLIISYVISNSLSSELKMSSYYAYPFIVLIAINVVYGYQMISTLIKIIIKEATTQK